MELDLIPFLCYAQRNLMKNIYNKNIYNIIVAIYDIKIDNST